MKILKWLGIISLGLMVLLLILLHLAAGWFRQPDRKIATFFEKEEVAYQIHREDFAGCPLRWIESGNLDSDQIIFFSHGAPGGFSDFSEYMVDPQLTKDYRLISMDRPGYGYSNYGQAQTSIVEQAAAVNRVLDLYQPKELVVVGYSYGGPIAGAYAARYPDSIKALLLLAPVIAPEGEKLFWFNGLLDTWLAKVLLPKFIHVANEEKLAHAEALRTIAEDWAKIEVPVYHLHCMDDWIAPFEVNTGWTQANIPAKQLHQVIWDGDSHFLPNSIKDRVDPVLDEILKIE